MRTVQRWWWVVGLLGALGASAQGSGELKGWDAVDALVRDQKFEAAADAALARLGAAKAKKDEAEWTRALVKTVQLRIGLHGYETAVRFLREEPWPQGQVHRAALNLYYAHALVQYARTYSWEISQRERVESKGPVDLKAWTVEQIHGEAQRAFEEIWRGREGLGTTPVGALSEYLTPNTYPKGVRDTLRDAISYLRVEFLADSSAWRPEQSNELYTLDLGALIAGDPKRSSAVKLDDPATHPLVRIGAVLDDLEAWHGSANRREAALEARVARQQRLHAAFTSSEDRARIRSSLGETLKGQRGTSWFAAGKAALAEMWRDSGDLVTARQEAIEGRSAYPTSVGGQRCDYLVRQIEAPDFQLSAMAADGPQKRSIAITGKNLPSVYFRAYGVDLEAWIAKSKDYSLLPTGHELTTILRKERPLHEWSVSLPATPDFRPHRTFVTPPMRASGLYVVVASARSDFAESANRLLATNLVLGDLTLVVRDNLEGGVEVSALSGESGRPVEGAEVKLYRMDYQRAHQVVETRRSDANGSVVFGFDPKRGRQSHFLVARHGEHVALEAQPFGFHQVREPSEVSAALVFTDRSVYRPQQQLQWKVVAYRGAAQQGRFRTQPDAELTVRLVDPNHQTVDTRKVRTNSYGTASGSFTVPTGRLLGNWRLLVAPNQGSAQVRVEEYKRPTFEVSFKEPEGALRLNQPARLTGEVRYYFGLPVSSGTIRWRVRRSPDFPWWWDWGEGDRGASAQVVAGGTASLAADGTFAIAFTPAADERLAENREVTYRYVAEVDVTDDGGETRSATRSVRLGFVAVEATVASDREFFLEHAGGVLTVRRTDLSGGPRSGKGTWKLVPLQQPAKPLLPAEEPVPEPRRGDKRAVITEGDRLRPRWETRYSPEATLRRWADGAPMASGELQHDAKGEAELRLPKLAAGAYRVRYQTVDEFGARFETFRDIVVAGPSTPLAVPAALLLERGSVSVGETARLLVHSGLGEQLIAVDVVQGRKQRSRRRLLAGKGASLVELPIGEADRGGLAVTLTVLRDFQLMTFTKSIFVPWDSKELKVEFASFRDKIRPGAKETFRVTARAADKSALGPAAVELLGYMYDQSLDIFAPHRPSSVMALYPHRGYAPWQRSNLGPAWAQWIWAGDLVSLPAYPPLNPDEPIFYGGYGIGGPGRRGRFQTRMLRQEVAAADSPDEPRPAAPAAAKAMPGGRSGGRGDDVTLEDKKAEVADALAAEPGRAESPPLRSEFSETAFFLPHLVAGPDGTASFEFQVPDSVTAWNVWVHALTRDLRGGSTSKTTRSVKELMVRPYLPRFLREGDKAAIKVVVNNASSASLKGVLKLEIVDPQTGTSLASSFALGVREPQPFSVEPSKGATLTFPVIAPARLGPVAFRVVATAGDFSDGELRQLPVLPSRMHLAQSRFATLKDKDKQSLVFADMARGADPSLIHEQLVVTIDAQLFYTVLQSLPYLLDYPYECTEQTMNRFLSAGIVTSVFRDHPAVAKMAKEMSKRETRFESFDALDPNRKMALEESPWLIEAKGGKDPLAEERWLRILDPKVAEAERAASLAKLQKAQTSLGGFPWWPGGPPSPHMTLYIVHGLARAAEFKVDVPKEMVQRAWQYLARHFRDEYAARMMKDDCCWEFLTFLNYVASTYPDSTWTKDALTAEERKQILEFSFKHWRRHSPYLKGYLALTLQRMGRPEDARKVFDSVMDSAKTTPEDGTHWAPEDRAWLWYNDSIETHAFALRVLGELSPRDPRRAGLVQWLLINKKLNHWKSTRATAEVIYALVKYLQAEEALGVREESRVTIGPRRVSLEFLPDRYTGKRNQIVIPGPELEPKTMSTVVVEKDTKGFQFASATWHFSTEKLPEQGAGDLFTVKRAYFRRVKAGREVVLRPLAEGERLEPGDELEVHLSLRSRHEAEYVHLRDPRAAGLEPENAVSRYRWNLGVGWYEETRDSGTNFFFDRLPAGEYPFKYRLRANLGGVFRVGPATVQSMYAPEFSAYSAGHVVSIGTGGK